MKKTKTIQIRVSEEEKDMITYLYNHIDDFKLSIFLRKQLKQLYLRTSIANGIGMFKVK